MSECIRTNPQLLQAKSAHVAILPVGPAVPPGAPVGFPPTSWSANCPRSSTNVPRRQTRHSGFTPAFSSRARILFKLVLAEIGHSNSLASYSWRGLGVNRLVWDVSDGPA